MVYPFEFIRGIMITSATFITVAGIFLAVRDCRKYFRKWSIFLLLISLVLGAVVITTSLVWFREPTDLKAILALWLLIVQFIIFCIPVFKVIISFNDSD